MFLFCSSQRRSIPQKGDDMSKTFTTQPPERTSVHLTWQDWLPYLEDSDASDEDKRQLIETLWSIMLAFVDLGWDIAPTENPCGQSSDLTAVLRAAVLYSEGPQKPEKEEP